MTSHDQAVTLVASPSYPNSIAWSMENLVAIASGYLITILNPALPVRPRGLITLRPSNPFPIGVVKREDLLSACIMPTCLSRDVRPCARSISWSHPGFAHNSGCLLAVCTTEGRVKLYRPPLCEFRPEWVEAATAGQMEWIIGNRNGNVVDISDLLYHYLKSITFGELKAPSVTFLQGQDNAGCFNESVSICEMQDSVSSKLPKRRKTKTSSKRIEGMKYIETGGEELPNGGDRDILLQNSYDRNDDLAASRANDKMITSTKVAINPCSIFKHGSSSERSARQLPEKIENDVLPIITSRQYASRSALLSSLIVAWSPVLQSSGVNPLTCFTNNCAILAVGGKSGNISFWRIYEPQYYTVEHGRLPVDPVLIGLLQAHKSWITAISWGIYAASSSESQLVLATGCGDGSVKIWLGDVEELIKTSEANRASFSLLREVTAVTSAPISTMSLVVPVQSLDKVVLAIGKGSGSLEVWICHVSSNKLQSAGVYNAHNQVVTGLAWAFDGGCLYSCSQDNSVRSWVLNGSSLSETPFNLNFPGLKTSTNLVQVSDLCFGLALSPGELMVAVVRSFDSDLLNQMYQARTQKAAVQFFWTGGQSLGIPSDSHLNGSIETFSGLTERDLVCWESTILLSLKRYDNVDKPLVLWDVLTALHAFKKCAPTFVENILFKWISSWFLGYQLGDSIEKILFHAQSMLSKISTRRIHLLNIICRRLMLSEIKADIYNGDQHKFNGSNGGEEGKLDLWIKLLVNSERELQERFVSFTFKAVLSRESCSPGVLAIGSNWSPVGVAQMERWIAINPELVHDQLKLLGTKIGELGSRIHSICEYVMEESCSFCSASVPFESHEVAWCEGIKHQDGSKERHELKRCAVSMQLGSITAPMWFCMCCHRLAAKLPPQSFFTVYESPLDVNYESGSFALQERSKPFCPFCGVLLQRFLPDFLLSASPV